MVMTAIRGLFRSAKPAAPTPEDYGWERIGEWAHPHGVPYGSALDSKRIPLWVMRAFHAGHKGRLKGRTYEYLIVHPQDEYYAEFYRRQRRRRR